MPYSLLQQFEFFKLPFLIICFDKYHVCEPKTKKGMDFKKKKFKVIVNKKYKILSSRNCTCLRSKLKDLNSLVETIVISLYIEFLENFLSSI